MYVQDCQIPTIRPAKQATLRRLATEEDGAAYTLSYVMVIPVYALLMCLIIESVLMMTAKLGTVYSAYAAARSASVWSSATSWDKAQTRAKQAAIQSMVPFASGTQSVFASTPTSGDASKPAVYLSAYNEFTKKPIAAKYVIAKFGYASRHVKVEIVGPPKSWDADITAKVTYEFAFNVPGIGRLIGTRGADGHFYYSITSAATIPNEGVQDNRKTIGIGYGTLE